VDFGPYMQRVVHDVKLNWYSAIPSIALPPSLKSGTVALEFAIAKNGNVEGLRYATSSGDVQLDRACYFGVSRSSPFSPLPSEYKSQSLRIRMTFYYNPGASVGDSTKSR
jgi:TonB family protein